MFAFPRRRLGAEELLQQAQRRAGLTDFGDTPFLEGLQMFLQACAEEAELGLFGLFATRWDVLRFLSNLLQLHHHEVMAPEILEQPIERPIFITGVPRSGTTYLHQLLTNDPANRVPRVWQLIHPYQGAETGQRTDRRQKQVARQLKMFQLLAPEFRTLHPINATSPQECSEITAHVFASLRFDTNYFVPSYRHWVDSTGHLEAYRFHKRFLQHLAHQAGGGGRWVLKCPDHVFALTAIRAVYPDARLVFVHRDPVRVLLSVTRLTEVLRRPFTRYLDRTQLGRDVSERWLAGTDLMIEAADQQAFADPIFHVAYVDLVSDPLGAVERLYRHFALDLDAAAANRIRHMTDAQPNGGYNGANRYSFETYQIDPLIQGERYGRYMARFDIAPEFERPRRASPGPVLTVGRAAEPAD
jgi:hypothetical protein